MKVAVGSKNPVKIEAVRLAFEQIWPKKKWQVVGIKVNHGITDQPMSDRESIQGAKNRSRRALKKLGADFGVGLEGGLQKIGRLWFDCGWATEGHFGLMTNKVITRTQGYRDGVIMALARFIQPQLF